MASMSKIEWTESTWNPITGCTKISDGCKNCYAERLARRLKAMKNPNYANGFKLTMHEQCLALPLMWKKPRMIFVNSMSDLFHEDVTSEFVQKVFSVMREAYWHTFQVLTKRSGRMLEMSEAIRWPSNVWMGVSVENDKYIHRIENLSKTGAHVKFISFEPLLGPIQTIPLDKIDWVIVGGESGPGARVIDKEWVRHIRDECTSKGVPFFFKQWGGINKKKTGRTLDNRIWNEIPVSP